MVSEIPSDRSITKTIAPSDKAPPPTSVRLSQVQAEVSSSVKIATSAVKVDAAQVSQDHSTIKPATQGQTTSTANPVPNPTTNSATNPPRQNPPPKELYNATVVFNRQASAGSTYPATTSVATQLTTDVIQRINQGLMTIVRITTDLPLLKGDQLIVNTSPSTASNTVPGTSATTLAPSTSQTLTSPPLAATPHLELQQLHSIPNTQRIQQTIINLVRLLVPTQNSYSPLLNNILSLVSGKPELLKQLPPYIQQAIKQISQHLPNSESLRTADTVKQAIKHSGVLFESSLKHESLKHQPIESQPRKYQPSLPIASTRTYKPNSSSDTVASAATNITRSQQPSANPVDFKHQLLSLEKALLSAAKTTSAAHKAHPVTTKTALDTQIISDPSKIIQKTASTINSSTNPTVSSTATTTVPTSTAAETKLGYAAPSEKQQLQNLMQLAKAQQSTTEIPSTKHQPSNVKGSPEPSVNRTTPSTDNTTPSPKPLAIQTYQTASSHNAAPLHSIPPLPGQHLMQAQTNIKATLKGDVIADALVKILLKQTQETISRLQLHQLSTAAAHVDDGAQVTQAPLSFDLPILHFGQLTLFHFHIEEEAQKNAADKETSADKKWNVSMGFDIEGLGAMFCELSLINTYVYVKFWAKEKDTVSRAKRYFDVLQKNLHQIGATVKELECIEGLPPQQESSITPSLIDVET